jgi:RimJ/RimL family protein N-acetyltransferase
MNGFLTAKPPVPLVLEGRYARLEPIGPEHLDGLFAASSVPDAEQRFAYLFENPPKDREAMAEWLSRQLGKTDPQVCAVVDRANGKVGGRQQLMRIDAPNGVIEIGGIYWGPAISRTRVATEALYLTARHVFDDLGYRRFEWKCNNRNAPSKQAAARFGFTFEGIFRQHMVIKGENRDTAWFSMLDGEWPARKAEFERWLDQGNFDAEGVQQTPLKQGIARD